jgi:hypothetical protein
MTPSHSSSTLHFLQAASVLDVRALEQAGCQAWTDGLPRSANPYRTGSAQAMQRPEGDRAALETCVWWLGWDKAALTASH